MNLNYKLNILLIILFLFFNISCVSITKTGGYEPYVRPLKNYKYKVVGKGYAFTSNFNLLWLFSVTDYANYDRAISNIINQKNGDDIIEVHWWVENQYWIIGTINIIHIEAKVIKYEYE